MQTEEIAIYISLVIIILVGLGGGYWWWKKRKDGSESMTNYVGLTDEENEMMNALDLHPVQKRVQAIKYGPLQKNFQC